MVWHIRILCVLSLFGLLLPVAVHGQDKQKDKDKEEKKVEIPRTGVLGELDKAKKKTKTTTKEPPEERLSYSQVIKGSVKFIDPKSNRDFSIEIQVVDPEKVFKLKQWQSDQTFAIARDRDLFSRQRRLLQFNMENAKRQNDIYKKQEVALQATENVKVRSMNPPVQYDDKGNLKRWTVKELLKLKGTSRLPGYPSELDALRPDQQVQIYIGKVKRSNAKPGELGFVPEPTAPPVVLIVILAEPQTGIGGIGGLGIRP